MYDLVIRNGTIYDGKGGKPYLADLAVTGKTITKIGIIQESGTKEIDAKGSFESDDETGAIFKQIQDTIKQLDSYKGEEE